MREESSLSLLVFDHLMLSLYCSSLQLLLLIIGNPDRPNVVIL